MTPHTGIRATTLVLVGLVTTVVAWLVLRWSSPAGAEMPAARLGGDHCDGLPRCGPARGGWQVRKVRDGRSDGRVSALRAARTLVLAQAAALTGSVLVGWYLANVLALLPDADVQSQRDRILPFVLHAAVALLLALAAWSCSGGAGCVLVTTRTTRPPELAQSRPVDVFDGHRRPWNTSTQEPRAIPGNDVGRVVSSGYDGTTADDDVGRARHGRQPAGRLWRDR